MRGRDVEKWARRKRWRERRRGDEAGKRRNERYRISDKEIRGRKRMAGLKLER